MVRGKAGFRGRGDEIGEWRLESRNQNTIQWYDNSPLSILYSPILPLLCGIMIAMENSNPDETRPTPVQPEESVPFDLSDTQPTSLEQPQEDGPAFDPTQPVEVFTVSESQPDYDATVPVQTRQEPPPPPPPVEKAKRRFRLPPAASWSLLGLLGLLLIGVLSAFGGYNEGIRLRKQAEIVQKSSTAAEQFQLGLQDMEAGNYDRARQRFEYVIELDPGFPGVTEKLADVLMLLNATATPTIVPTPTLTPTPDTRNVDQLFSQAQQDLANSNWSAAIDTLLALRKADPNFQPVWVDDMLFVAFRNRGKDKILGADLEGGIYDLTIAAQFGYLDFDSRSLQDWARLYLTGASFWELDWSQAVFYFAQIAPALPNLSDGSGWTAAQRYRLALIGYGEDLIEQTEWCSAKSQLELALSMGPDERGQALYDQAASVCDGDSGEETDTGGSQPTQETQPAATTEPPPQPTPTTEVVSTEPPPEGTPSP